jgi:RND superfamily putative drug exporter
VDSAVGSYSRLGRAVIPADEAAQYAKGHSTYLKVIADVEPISPASEPIIRAIRAMPAPSKALVTGYAVNAYDVKTAIVRTFPRALVFIMLATFIALFLQFGSLLVPLKAIVLNVLSLSALFGAMVWVFQEGHLNGLLNVTATGWLYVNLPILIFCVAFGLSMDYEVFLLSRIKEEYDRGSTNEQAIALGLERSGRIVSSAALLIAVVFLTSGIAGSIQFSKAFGLGLSLVVLGDAFLIRGTLVPALMKLAGPANWWLPGPLQWIHQRFGITERHNIPGAPAADAKASSKP